jgi:hypothetical protein
VTDAMSSSFYNPGQSSGATEGGVGLEFPIAPDFVSVPPRIELQAMLRRIEENMPWRSTRPGEQERRLADKVNVEFVL